jgi:hypothetical protein
MSALRLALINNGKIKRNTRKSNSNSSMSTLASTIANDDIYLNPEHYNDENILFYAAVANAFDHSPTVREYFHNNRSRTQSDNKTLWPLHYQAYKEYGI